ncbi:MULTISPECIES: DUF5372 family protein [unclassified Pseudofrankia]|uniref:DUF5372 family protein n=1 Tax=unclassified Pseudofrankia TaxID=2994372 RepID=UPI001041F470|nr:MULTISPECIES: DUF5372 family protein [unclassified Pseudofrankia]MDT3445733.1 DUF5372 family protein [Pseudofrankia sp. BMG5.37]
MTRPGHPFEGRELRVLGRMRRHGALELILELPDGSKSMMPAAWTDQAEPAADGGGTPVGEPTLGRICDLLELTRVVAGLLPSAVSGVVDVDIREKVEACPRKEAPDAVPARAEPSVAGAARGRPRRGGAAAGRRGRGGGGAAGPADRGSGAALFDGGEQ